MTPSAAPTPTAPAVKKPKQPQDQPKPGLMERFVGQRVAVVLMDGSVRRGLLARLTKYEILLNETVIQKHSIVSVDAHPGLEKAAVQP